MKQRWQRGTYKVCIRVNSNGNFTASGGTDDFVSTMPHRIATLDNGDYAIITPLPDGEYKIDKTYTFEQWLSIPDQCFTRVNGEIKDNTEYADALRLPLPAN